MCNTTQTCWAKPEGHGQRGLFLRRLESMKPVAPPSLVAIFLAFLRIGCTAFGGPAMIPYIRRMALERKGWLDAADFELGMGAAQIIPGATAMQVAAYVGLRVRGILGGLAAYLGFGLPAFGLMLGLSALYFHSHDLPVVLAVFSGLKVVVTALVLNAAWDFGRCYLHSPLHVFLAAVAGFSFWFEFSPILVLVAICAVAAIFFQDEVDGSEVNYERKERAWLPAIKVGVVIVLGLGVLFVVAPHLFDLAWMMAKIDSFAFGGGYVSLPLMLHEVTSRGIMDEAMLMEGIALGQVTPGPIVMTATFVGYFMYGVIGAVVGTLFVFAPSFLFLVLVVPYGQRVIHAPVARKMLIGSLVTLVGLLAAMGPRLALAVQWGAWEVVIGLAALVALRLRVDILWVVLGGAAISALRLF